MKDYNQTCRLVFALAALGSGKSVEDIAYHTRESEEICEFIYKTIKEAVIIDGLLNCSEPEVKEMYLEAL